MRDARYAMRDASCPRGSRGNGPRPLHISNLGSRISSRRAQRSGSALIVALWVLLILAMLIGSFAYEMTVESEVTVFARKRVKAQYLAQAGVEWAKAALSKKTEESADGELNLEADDDEQLYVAALNINKGVGVSGVRRELGPGSFQIDLLPEEGRRNVNKLADGDWEEILDQANVPEEQWPELIDCFTDWVDGPEGQQLNGAESDDSYYKKRGYMCKDAPLDTVDELLLIKGFTEEIVYGRAPEEGEDPADVPKGIAGWLTTWGDGKVNVNTASSEVLMTLQCMDEYIIESILEKRKGFDGTPNTADDGIKSLDEISGLSPALKERLTTTERKYIRVMSIGEVQGVRSGIWCILTVAEQKVTPVYWREEAMP
jgi:general secretion pathway protein K